MKNKQKKAWSFAIAITLATMLCIVAVIGCKDEPDPTPPNDDNVVKERSTTITLFEGKTATVKGNFTKSELETVAGKMADRINTSFNTNTNVQGPYREIFDRGVIYIVESNPDYEYYKTIGDGKTIYIALSQVDSKFVTDALPSIYVNASTQAKAIDNSRKIFRMA